MISPLYQCLTKATIAEGDQLRHGPNWVLARRARLKVFAERIECGDWTVKREEIRKAVLYSVRQLVVIPGYVLKIETDGRTYHFGLNYGSFWTGDLPFPVEREKGKLSYSAFSIVLRLVSVGALIYLLWTYF